MKAIYIAGPDVFFRNPAEHFDHVKALLLAHGLKGVPPGDGELSKGAAPNPETAKKIFEENVRLIRESDGVLVNLNHFRGTEPDSGTCWELGFAYALGKPIVAYLDKHEMYADRVARICGVVPGTAAPMRFDAQEDCLIEEMGLPVNLMLVYSSKLVTTGVEDATKALAELLAVQAAAEKDLAALLPSQVS